MPCQSRLLPRRVLPVNPSVIVAGLCACGHTRGWHDTLLGKCQHWKSRPTPRGATYDSVPFTLCGCMAFKTGYDAVPTQVRTR